MTATIKTATTALRLPIAGAMRTHVLGEPGPWRRPDAPITSRIAYAAAHIVPRLTADSTPGAPADLDLLEEVAEAVKGSSLCGLGQTAPNPVLSTLRYFREEYEAHVVDHRCPAGKCPMAADREP